MKPEFSDTLKWFYRRALNPKDKQHCLRLLAQIQLKQEDAKKQKSTLTVHGQSVKTPTAPQRPSSAKVFGEKTVSPPYRERPKTASPGKKISVEFAANTTQFPVPRKEEKGKSTYQRQKESIARLSRPKTARQVSQHYQSASRPKSAMAAIGTQNI